MTDGPTPEQILASLITAAGNADAVRLASLVHNASVAGVELFNRPLLTSMWSERWRHHVEMPGKKPEQRVNRSVPLLTGCTALASVGGPDLVVLDADILQFLADRVYMAEALDAQAPASNTLPVGEATRAAAAALVSAAVDAAVPGTGGLAAQGARETERQGHGMGGEMTLTVEAEVIKGTPQG